MLFNELTFLYFFVFTFAVYWSLRSNVKRKAWLLLTSYAFYANWNWKFLGLIVASTVIDYCCGLLLQRVPETRARKLILAVSLACNLGLLAVFKYLGFFVESAGALLTQLGFEPNLPTLQILLPVGISFYTFQTLSYTIDLYRRRIPPADGPLDFALFVAFFPQLVAGPIVRAAHFLPQLKKPKLLSEVRVRHFLVLFLFGWIKKSCIADQCAVVVDAVFADPNVYGVLDHWLALCLYALQIYGDFSGYSDMAIASAGLLGYELVLNFDFPYLAGTVTEFWRRWHMSLSSWFRDYLYVPLGGNRFGEARTYFNLFAVFGLCGLWHGASLNFVLWGVFHGLFLVFERMLGWKAKGPPAVIAVPYTLLVVLLAWVLFRATTLGLAADYYAGLVRPPGPVTSSVDVRWWLVIVGFALVHVAMRRRWLHDKFRALPDPVFAAVFGVGVALALPFAKAGYRAFIYFQF